MKNQNLKSFIAGSFFTLALSSSVVYGAGITKTISATFGDVQLQVNNKPVEQETLLYNGTTYIPLRSAGDILGLDVNYDGATKTAYLNDKNTPYNKSTSVSDVAPVKEDSNAKIYEPGGYLVGTDLQPGIYKITTTSRIGSYVERLSGLGNSDDDIIVSKTFYDGGGYIEVLPTDEAIVFTGGTLSLIDYKTYNPTVKTTVSDGVFLVGKDIAPGIYKITCDDSGLGYFSRLSGLDGTLDNIIDNDIFYSGSKYVEVLPTDKALDVTGTATKQ